MASKIKKPFNHLQFGCVPANFLLRLHRGQAYLCYNCEKPTMASFGKDFDGKFYCLECFSRIKMENPSEKYYQLETRNFGIIRDKLSMGVKNWLDESSNEHHYNKLES